MLKSPPAVNASRSFSRTTAVAIAPTFDVPLRMSRCTRPTLNAVRGSISFRAVETVSSPSAFVDVVSTIAVLASGQRGESAERPA